ncbi:hypothetical protein [Bacillus sinesaloumensis]|nr:hypothetical protein [Bacillus sinesaloumensis]
MERYYIYKILKIEKRAILLYNGIVNNLHKGEMPNESGSAASNEGEL